jgi:hypothetical protein
MGGSLRTVQQRQAKAHSSGDGISTRTNKPFVRLDPVIMSENAAVGGELTTGCNSRNLKRAKYPAQGFILV